MSEVSEISQRTMLNQSARLDDTPPAEVAAAVIASPAAIFCCAADKPDQPFDRNQARPSIVRA